jgi:dephospho-CoA kinase
MRQSQLKDKLDMMEANYAPIKGPTQVTLVTGPAGAGKTTFTQAVEQAYDFSIYHDYWVEEQYKVPWVSAAVAQLFPSILPGPTGYSKMTKELVLAALKEDPMLNTVLANYFKSKFAIYISTLFKKAMGNVIVECPFLDENITALKDCYEERIKVLYVKVSVDEQIKRLKERGWDDNRIGLSQELQRRMMADFMELIDEYV